MSRRVSILGGPGSFSEEAALGLLGKDITLVPAAMMAEVPGAIARGQADLAVLPIENSIAGAVDEALDAWGTERLYAFAESALVVRQCLLVLPGVKLEEVKEVWSHPHALAQCTPFLREHGLTPVPVASTVAGAETVSRRRQRHLAALGSVRTAAKWSLSVLAHDIQSVADNFTRFVALSPAPLADPTGGDKTTFRVEPKGSATGLEPLLALLQGGGVRLLRLHVRPVPAQVWRQVFFLDVAGHVQEPPLARMLPQLEERAGSFQWMGSYPARVASGH